MGPLKGIRVVEMAGLGPAPMCGMMLSDLGAEVFVVDRVSGASAEASLHVGKRDMIRRGKVPLPLDLKEPDAIELLLTLIEQSDVLIESYRPGVMERLGLGPDTCLDRNPRLVYGRLSGWGQDGPLAQTSGHDANYIAMTGALYHSGNAGEPPLAPLTMMGDAAGGAAMFAWGISSALIPAIREGKGQVVDAAIFEGTAYLTTLARSFYNTGHLNDQRQASWTDGAAPWNHSYRTSDGGYVAVLPVEAKFYRVLLEKLDLLEHPLFADLNQWDQERWPAQVAHLADIFASRSRDHWCELLEGTDACFAPVLTYGEAPLHPHAKVRGTYKEVDGAWHPQPAPRYSGTPAEPAWEDHEVDAASQLREIGIEDSVIERAGLNGR